LTPRLLGDNGDGERRDSESEEGQREVLRPLHPSAALTPIGLWRSGAARICGRNERSKERKKMGVAQGLEVSTKRVGRTGQRTEQKKKKEKMWPEAKSLYAARLKRHMKGIYRKLLFVCVM